MLAHTFKEKLAKKAMEQLLREEDVSGVWGLTTSEFHRCLASSHQNS